MLLSAISITLLLDDERYDRNVFFYSDTILLGDRTQNNLVIQYKDTLYKYNLELQTSYHKTSDYDLKNIKLNASSM